MAVKLRGEDDYYSTTVEIDGSEFKISDLSEDEYEQYVRDANALRQVLEVEGEDLVDLLHSPEDMLELQMRVLSDPEKQLQLRRKQRDLIHFVLAQGLVDWDLPVDEVDGTKLPTRVKRELAQAILTESRLDEDEETFPGGLGTVVDGAGQ